MATKTVTLSLPTAMVEKIDQIINETRMFESHEDVIMHAITDILERYDNGGGL